MDLPTYTSIWRIEKRLYKLYDFRLPMPLPIGQLAVFAAIAVPYVVLLTMLGLPFSHSLIWLYVLPPGVATWLVTRPVLEGKRLPELLGSQLRYLAEPRIWCRMAPLAESDIITVSGRVWPSAAGRGRRGGKAEPLAAPDRQPAAVVRPGTAPRVEMQRPAAVAASTEPQPSALARQPTVAAPPPRQPADSGPPPQPATAAPPPRQDVAAARPLRQPAAAAPAAWQPAATAEPPSQPRVPVRQPPPAVPPWPQPSRPTVTIVTSGSAQDAPPSVERALAGPSQRLGEGRTGRVTVVPGGHRPGKPDQLQRDRARAQQQLSAHGRVIVLGCTVGAGQTVTTLLTGDVLASLRSDNVAVLDLNPGSGSLARQALLRPALGQAASLGPSRLAVLTHDGDESDGENEPGEIDPAAAVSSFEHASAAYQIVIADPSTSAVIRLLAVADQLILVAPASAAAARAIGMTFEWLEAHGRAGLAADAIMVMNGVSRRTTPFVEQAERLCIGRCRAIVRVPWDEQLKTRVSKRASYGGTNWPASQQWAGVLTPATVSACTALAGVLVTALVDREPVAVGPGPVPR